MSNQVSLGVASNMGDKILTCAKYLDYLPPKSIVRNGYSGSYRYFVQLEPGDWYPCNEAGRMAIVDYKFRAESIFLPVEVMRRGMGQ